MSNSQFAVLVACLSATTFGFVWVQTEPKDSSPAAEQAGEFLTADTVYYAGCDEARAAGAAPIYKGQPGYREDMDGDGDGIACEPYRKW